MVETKLNGEVASIVLAAGKGSRMLGYDGNKTLLPLVPRGSLYEGEHPLLIEVLGNLPAGPKAVVVHHFAEQVRGATHHLSISYLFQPTANGTGGALLAARPYLETIDAEQIVITMGDVPLIRPETYQKLLQLLGQMEMAVLAFSPKDRAQYGMLETEAHQVLRIVEWKYWSTFSPERQAALKFCNAGVYAAKRSTLLIALGHLADQPHTVKKQRGDEWVSIEEYFLTDLVELVSRQGHPVGYMCVPEAEVMGVDTPEALAVAQQRYAEQR